MEEKKAGRESTWVDIDTDLTRIRRGRLPSDFVEELREAADDLLTDDSRLPHDEYLAGEIRLGEQVTLKDPKKSVLEVSHPAFEKLSKIVMRSTLEYIKHFTERDDLPIGEVPKLKRFSLTDLWLNVYKEGDYNPIHHHMLEFTAGLAFFIWLEFPDLSSFKAGSGPLFADGHTAIVWRANIHTDPLKQFVYPGCTDMEPVVGDMLIFPAWLSHLVYPFRGEGRRLSIAGNVGVEWEPAARGPQMVKFS